MSVAMITKSAPGSTPCAPAAEEPVSGIRAELRICVVLLLACNLHLLGFGDSAALAFFPQRLAAGEYYRIITHAAAHVSWYHLILDASAFLFLYRTLAEWKRAPRICGLLASLLGSALVSWLAAPEIETLGLCGLSGAAHGLMALVCLNSLRTAGRNEPGSKLLLIAFFALIAKCAFEAATGAVVLGGWYDGALGTPIAVCHAGGLLGALVAWPFTGGMRPR